MLLFHPATPPAIFQSTQKVEKLQAGLAFPVMQLPFCVDNTATFLAVIFQSATFPVAALNESHKEKLHEWKERKDDILNS